MDKQIGNFLTQANKDFPLDCETLSVMESNRQMVETLGNLAGDKTILWGCALTDNGARRGEGYVFLCTSEHPEGEVLRFEGGSVSAGLYLKKEDVSVSASGYDYPKAYTKRSLAAGLGSESWQWSDFKELPTIAELQSQVVSLRSSLSGVSGAPLGVVHLWAGSTVPEGYALCDGQQLKQADYPDLYAAIGNTFNTAVSASGVKYTTQSGYFRLPDLRGRFVVGYHDSDNDYNVKGAGGGEKKHILTADEMPSHVHEMKDYYYVEAHNEGNYDVLTVNGKIGSGKTDHDNTNLYWVMHNTESKGGSASHENRPPYYVLAYIMKLK